MTLRSDGEQDIPVERLMFDKAKRCFVPAEAKRTLAAENQFLRGPVPWWWVVKAELLPGRALAVGLCIWRLVGVMKKDQVRLSTKETEALGIDRFAKSRALRALEKAGLVTVERKRGRFPIVTVIRTFTPPMPPTN